MTHTQIHTRTQKYAHRYADIHTHITHTDTHTHTHRHRRTHTYRYTHTHTLLAVSMYGLFLDKATWMEAGPQGMKSTNLRSRMRCRAL